MKYTILCSLDVFNGNGSPASALAIFFVVRDEPDINDVRSIRTELKRYIDVMQEKMEQKLESKIQKVENKIEKGFAQMHELIAGLNQRTQEVPAMDEESEGLEPPHGNISPRDVEIEAAIEPSEEVSHTEEVEEVTKSTPKTKKKAKRQTKRSAVTTWRKTCWSSHSWKMSWVSKGICLCSLCVAKPCGYPNGMRGQIGYMYQIDLLQYEHSKETCQKNLSNFWSHMICFKYPIRSPADWLFFPKGVGQSWSKKKPCHEAIQMWGDLLRWWTSLERIKHFHSSSPEIFRVMFRSCKLYIYVCCTWKMFEVPGKVPGETVFSCI